MLIHIMTESVLFIADQPFEIRFFIEVKKRLNPSINASLAIVDLFTFNFGSDVILEAKQVFSNQVFDLESNFIFWQSRYSDARHVESMAFLNLFEYQIHGKRSLEMLRKSDPYVNSFEFSRFYRKLPQSVIDVAHADTIKWVQYVLHQTKPSLLCSISNTMFANSIFFELSNQLDIPFLTVMHSRIETRWVPRFDFFFGMSETLKREVIESRFSLSSKKKVLELRAKIENDENFELYPSGIPDVSRNYRIDSNLSFTRRAFSSLMKIAKWFFPFFRTVITGPRTRKLRAKYFIHSFAKIIFFEFLRDLRPPYRERYFVKSVDTNLDFFLWPLHFRPEGVVLIQGEGKDELRLIEYIAELLPKNYFLVVKESPIMVGIRDARFYKQIKSIPRVILASPALNSRNLIRASRGVIGLTGTALLESQLLGRPSWAIGSPEFAPFINGSGIDGVGLFMRGVAQNSMTTNDALLNQYLCWIFENSSETDNLLWPSSSIEKLDNDFNRLVNILQQHLKLT